MSDRVGLFRRSGQQSDYYRRSLRRRLRDPRFAFWYLLERLRLKVRG